MMKKRTAISILTLSMLTCACSSAQSSTSTEYANTTVYGQITALSLDSISITEGSVSEVEMSQDFMNNFEGMQPDDNASDQDASNQSQPSLPSGEQTSDQSQTPPDLPEGNMDQGQMLQDDMSQGSGQMEKPDDAAASEEDSGENQNSDQMQMPDQGGMDFGGGMNMTMYSFTTDEDAKTLTFDLSSTEYAYADADDNDFMQQDIDLKYLYIGAVVEIEVGEDGKAANIYLYSNIQTDADENSFSNDQNVSQGTSANTIDSDETVEQESYTSDGDDENALRVDGATVSLDSITVDKSGGASSNTEDGDFYGMNAALLATNGANVTLTNSTVTSNAQNGNGVFSYGTGTKVTVENTTIETKKDNSGGIQTTGGATTIAKNLTVTTQGSSSAAIRSDRGGGTVEVSGGEYTTRGYNSPAIYSTADITVSDAALTAQNSEALVVEGKNSITLTNSTISGNMSSEKGSSSDINVHNIMIYQSMSGDAEQGEGSLSLSDCTLTSQNGDLFFFTNTQASLLLNHTTLNNEGKGNLLTITGNDGSKGWGTAGSNGAQVVVTAQNQSLEGDIVVDDISTLDLSLSGGSSFTGAITITANEWNGEAVENNVSVHIDKSSSWKLSGNCTISVLDNEGTIDFNGYTITLADGTVLSS